MSQISLLGRIPILHIEVQDCCTLDDASSLHLRRILNKDQILTTYLGHRLLREMRNVCKFPVLLTTSGNHRQFYRRVIEGHITDHKLYMNGVTRALDLLN